MIKFLSGWIEGIAIAVIIASLFEIIIPNGNLKKYIKVILGMYVIFSIIAPFVNSNALYSINMPKELEGDFDETNSNYDVKNNTEELNKIYINTFEKELEQTIQKKGFNVYRCSVEGIFDADKKDAGIKKIQIVLDSRNASYEGENETEDNNINVNEVEKIEINIGEKTNKENSQKITNKDISELKKYLSEHYEIEQKIINIQKR